MQNDVVVYVGLEIVLCNRLGRDFGEFDADVFVAGWRERSTQVEVLDIDGESFFAF
jgi:hypothetical protein